jgi:hypothetical protein
MKDTEGFRRPFWLALWGLYGAERFARFKVESHASHRRAIGKLTDHTSNDQGQMASGGNMDSRSSTQLTDPG